MSPFQRGKVLKDQLISAGNIPADGVADTPPPPSDWASDWASVETTLDARRPEPGRPPLPAPGEKPDGRDTEKPDGGNAEKPDGRDTEKPDGRDTDGGHAPLGRVERLSDGTVLKGHFENGRLQGRGEAHFADGRRYVGGFRDGRFHGEGTLAYPSGTVYAGGFKDNRRHGRATMSFSNGFKYVGQFIHHRASGHGILFFPNGARYEGQFKDGRFNGQGAMSFPDGTFYEGQFLDDRRHGHGEMTFPNGFRYTGRFEGNRPCGRGTLIFPDGGRYAGDIRNNKCNGYGSIIYADGTRYEGDFKDDKYHGKGRLVFTDGTIYEGRFHQDRYAGKGAVIHPDGRRETVRFPESAPADSPRLDADSIPLDLNARNDRDDSGPEGWDAPPGDDPSGDSSEKSPDAMAGRIIGGSMPIIPPPSQALRHALPGDGHDFPDIPESHGDDRSGPGSGPRHRATDGHWVGSSEEILVDNWLYMFGILHIYKKRLPADESVYATFYLPAGKVHLVCHGADERPEEMRRHREIYQQYGLNLIELKNEDIYRLDDILPKKLLQFGIRTF